MRTFLLGILVGVSLLCASVYFLYPQIIEDIAAERIAPESQAAVFPVQVKKLEFCFPFTTGIFQQTTWEKGQNSRTDPGRTENVRSVGVLITNSAPVEIIVYRVEFGEQENNEWRLFNPGDEEQRTLASNQHDFLPFGILSVNSEGEPQNKTERADIINDAKKYKLKLTYRMSNKADLEAVEVHIKQLAECKVDSAT